MLQRDVAMLRADSWWRTVIVCDRVLPYHLVTGLTFVGAVAAPTMACLKPGRGVVRWLDAAVCAECAPGAVGVPLYALLPWVYISRLLGHAGMYCPADSSTAFPCPVGTVAASIGGDSLASCIPCGPGTYSDLLGATSGTACVFCPVGTASRVAGASSLRNCSTCGPGTYGPSTGLASCTPCPAGTHQPNSGATTLEECLRCRSEQVAGLVQPTVDTSTSDTVALAQLVSGIGGLALVFVLAIVLGLSPGHLVKKLDVLCGTLHIPDDKHAMTFYRKSTPRGAVHRLRS